LSAFVNTICLIVALSALCGAVWSNIRVAKQLHAAGYSIWTFNFRARWTAWKGTNIVLFLSCWATGILALSLMQ
jgi:hypothetical protein